LAEWHVSPDYIVSHWTHELLNLMIEKLVIRKKREAGALPREDNSMSDSILFAQMGKHIEVVKK
jgi:hypothetical protein